MLVNNPILSLLSMIASVIATICLAVLLFCIVYCLVNPSSVKRLKTTMLVLAILYAAGTAPLLLLGVAQRIEIYRYQSYTAQQNDLTN